MSMRKWVAMLVAAAVGVALSAGAFADDVVPDGDGVVPVASSTLNFGTVCVGVPYTDTILVGIQRANDATDTVRVFGNGSNLTVSTPTDSSAALTETVPDSSIVLPSDWLTLASWPLGSIFSSDTGTVSVTLTASAIGASGTQTVSIRASGLNGAATPSVISRNVMAKVTWDAVNCTPEIKVEKSAAAEYFVAGGPVAYDYAVTNPGQVPLSNVAVTDDSCSSPAYVSGDTNTNNLLDLTETWLYSCSYTPAFTGPSSILDNVATATGKFGATTVDDKDGLKLMGAVVRKAVHLYWQAGGPDKIVPYDASGVYFDVDLYKRGVGKVGTEQVAEDDPLELWLTVKPSTASEPGWKFVEQAKAGYPVADDRGEIDFNVNPPGGDYLDSTLINTIDFNLSIRKTGPTFVGEDGKVTFDYAVKNVGPAAVTPVVTDDKCSPVELVSGDDNHDGLIQPTEKWLFKCSTTLTWYFGWNFDTGKQLCDTNTATVTDGEQPESSFWNPWEFYGGESASALTNNKSTVTLCPWIIRKDVREFGTGNDLSDTTAFTVTIKQGTTVVGTVTIKEGDPAQFWLAPGTYTFTETVLPFYIPNFETWSQDVGKDYPDWTVVNYKWYAFSPGYYKNHTDWGSLDPAAGYSTSQTVESVFDVPDTFGLDTKTLLQALSFQGGPGLSGKAQILLRAAVAALLNESRFGASFGDFTLAQLVTNVNNALASGSGSAMTDLATVLDNWNNGIAP